MDDRFTPALMPRISSYEGLMPGSGHASDQPETVYTPALMPRGDPFLPGHKVKAATGFKPASRPWDIPNWLDERLKGTAAYYPHALASYFHWRDLKHRPFPADGFTMGDSGGFTVMTKGAKIDPRHVLRWQVDTCKVGVVLDVPPVDVGKKRIFEDALDKTKKNTQLVLDHYLKLRKAGSPFRWWGVVHGWHEADLAHWHQQMADIYPFTDEGEGWAFKARPHINPRTTARVLRFVAQQPEMKKIHLLMTTGTPAIAVLLVLGPQAGVEFASYDSTTFTLQAINRTLMVPDADGFNYIMQRETGKERQVRDYLLETCDCLSCAAIRDDLQRYPDLAKSKQVLQWSGYWVFRFAYHNLLCTIQLFDNLRSAAKRDGRKVLEAMLGRDEANTIWRVFAGNEPFTESTGTPRDILSFL